jgi:hypothetical protein
MGAGVSAVPLAAAASATGGSAVGVSTLGLTSSFGVLSLAWVAAVPVAEDAGLSWSENISVASGICIPVFVESILAESLLG